jgi:4-amino-4-deoxy-L-arabinose transferase-like glycosyltransferase
VVVTLLVAFALVARVTMAVTVPPWQAPDEPKQFEVVQSLVVRHAQLWNERRLLNADDASPDIEGPIIASMAAHHYWEYFGLPEPRPLPPSFDAIWHIHANELGQRSLLYFSIAAVCLLPFSELGVDPELLIVRLVSATVSALAVAATYGAARELVPRDRFVPTVSAAFVATLPMHAFMGGAVNPDSMVSLMGSVVALALATAYRRGFGIRRWTFIVVALILALAAKRTAVVLVPVVLLAWLLSLTFGSRRQLFAGLGLTASLALLGVTVWTGFGDVGQLTAVRRFVEELAFAYAPYRLGLIDNMQKMPFASPEVQGLIVGHLVWLFQSFWGRFGWFNLPLSAGLYNLLAVGSLICGGGFLAWLVQHGCLALRFPSRARTAQLFVILVYLSATAGMIALAVAERLQLLSTTEVPQGRYLFVVVTPIAVVYALGARFFLPWRYLGTLVPSAICVLGMVALDLVVYATYLLPFYVWRVQP